jgi:hypothetical protein
MRRGPFSGVSVVTLLTGVLVAASPAAAQLATEGAVFLLLPIGAKSVSLGQAVVAEQGGTEAVWWNPAGLARAEKKEIAVHHLKSIVGTGDAVSFLYPSDALGVLTASIFYLDIGEQPVTVPGAGTQVGTILPRFLVFAATYATPIGSRVNAGLTYKVAQFRVDCTGLCIGVPIISSSGSAIDAGVQYSVPIPAPIWVGIAVRNLGPKFQVKDSEQSDPLPTRLQVGATYAVTPLQRYARDVDVRVNADFIDELNFESPSARIGADISYRKFAYFRAGYVFKEVEGSEQFGPSIGLGLTAGRVQVDMARLFDEFSSGLGDPPTYLSLRYLF